MGNLGHAPGKGMAIPAVGLNKSEEVALWEGQLGALEEAAFPTQARKLRPLERPCWAAHPHTRSRANAPPHRALC
eukprot:8173687-Alexandrium_andersonii.AAC.1